MARHGARPPRRGMCAACVARQPPGIRQTPGGRRLRAHDCPCWRVTPLLLSNGSPRAVGFPSHASPYQLARRRRPSRSGVLAGTTGLTNAWRFRGAWSYPPRGAEPGLARPARRRRRCLQGRPPVGCAAAAGQPAGVLMASRGRCRVAPAERGRGRSQRASCGGGRLTGCCRDSDRPHAPRPGPPAAAAHHRQSGDPDRSPAARRAQRPAHGRPRRASDRHHRAPGISRSWPQNGRITAQ